MPTISISVADFAKPLIRKGSLKREGTLSGMEGLGALAHKKIEERLLKEGDYESEVTYRFEKKIGQFTIKLNGRADGVFSGTPSIIEEIKTSLSFNSLKKELEENDEHPYVLQAKTYLFMHRSLYSDEGKVRIRLSSLQKEQEELIPLLYDHESFKQYVFSRCKMLISEYKTLKKIRKRRKDIFPLLQFPFATKRKYQDQLLSAVSDTVEKAEKALIQAPTGIGKTMGFLYPSLKNSLKRGVCLVYTTPKNSQFKLIEDSCEKISQKAGKKIRTLTLTAKSKLCLNDQIICDGQHCPYADEFYTKLENTDVLDKLKRKQKLHRRALMDLGREYQVCPYYLSFEALSHADLIIGDYNYCFSQRAKLPGFLAAKAKKDQANLLIDEGHNLYERALEYYSKRLCKEHYSRYGEEILKEDSFSKELKKQWQKVAKAISGLFASHMPLSLPQKISLDGKLLLRVYAIFTEFLFLYLEEKKALSENDRVLELYFPFTEFVHIGLGMGDESESVYLDSDNGHEISIVCCDAKEYLKPVFEGFYSSLLFSATLKPFDFYKTLSGMQGAEKTLEFQTPFPKENRKLLVIPQISTAYRHRQLQYPKIAEAILRLSLQSKGHYFAFFPSYSFLNAVKQHLKNKNIEVYEQTPRMKEKEQKALLAHLYEKEGHSILLGVQGGIFAEGLDIRSSSLKGVFVVGPAIPQMNFERDLRARYYERVFGDGFAYAYIYPAMSKSIQAAGRVIRSEEKCGLIVLMDQRFIKKEYVDSMPGFWFEKSIMERVETGLLASVKNFWQDTLSSKDCL